MFGTTLRPVLGVGSPERSKQTRSPADEMPPLFIQRKDSFMGLITVEKVKMDLLRHTDVIVTVGARKVESLTVDTITRDVLKLSWRSSF